MSTVTEPVVAPATGEPEDDEDATMSSTGGAPAATAASSASAFASTPAPPATESKRVAPAAGVGAGASLRAAMACGSSIWTSRADGKGSPEELAEQERAARKARIAQARASAPPPPADRSEYNAWWSQMRAFRLTPHTAEECLYRDYCLQEHD